MKLLVVDDEYLVIEELLSITDWDLLGITEIYSATNAVRAEQILREKNIDIMFCDIEMPQADGLELLRRVKKEFPNLEVIMLTSHAQFAYVQSALRYGSYDYLLKPVMEEDIINVVRGLVTKIEQMHYQKYLQEEGQIWGRLKPVWKEIFWEELLRGLPDRSEHMEEERNRKLIPVLFYQYANDKEEADIRRKRQLVMDMFREAASGLLFPVLSQRMFAMLYFIENGETDTSFDKLICVLKTYRLHEQIGICMGEKCTGSEAWQEVERLRQIAINNVCSIRKILDYTNVPETDSVIEIPDIEIWKVLLKKGKYQELQNKIVKWIHCKGETGELNRRILQMLQYDLEQILYSVLQEHGIQAHQFLYYRESTQNRVTAIRSQDEMTEWVKSVLEDAAKILQKTEDSNGIKEQTIRYIKMHLGEDINRVRVAESMYLHPDYLDRRFKQETGCSVNRYILKEQINMAKVLLIEDKVSIGEIASRCGYENMSNFSVMFKREVGISPNEYRKSGGKEIEV